MIQFVCLIFGYFFVHSDANGQCQHRALVPWLHQFPQLQVTHWEVADQHFNTFRPGYLNTSNRDACSVARLLVNK